MYGRHLSIHNNTLTELQEIVGIPYLKSISPQDIENSDYQSIIKGNAQYVIEPKNTEEVSSIIKICQREQISVTPRGGGSGLTGAAVPVNGGIVLSCEE